MSHTKTTTKHHCLRTMINPPTIKSLGDTEKIRVPIEEYRDFTFKSEIDWIQLEIHTKEPTNFQTVRNRLDVPFVTPIDRGNGGASSKFSFRIHNPKNWLSIDATLNKLTHDHPLKSPVKVTGIEITLDAYSKTNNRDNLANLTARFYSGTTYLSSNNHRITSGTKISTNGINHSETLIKQLKKGQNVYIGEKTSPIKQHIYLKDTDKQLPIPPEEHRARTEITLTGSELPYQLLEDWKAHNFTEQSKYFKYRKIKPEAELSVWTKVAIKQITQFGERKTSGRGKSKRAKYSSSTKADINLNAKAYDSLRNLTSRMQGKRYV